MFTNAGEVLKFIGDQKVEFVDVRFCDLPGTVQHFTVPVESFDEKTFTDGLMFDGSSIRGFQQIHESDMLLMPDPSTAMLDPFRQHTTLNITFFVHDPLTGEPYSRDPRNIARKAQDFLRGTGIADTVYFGPEAEFYISDSARFATGANEGYYHLDSIEGAWNTGRDEDGGNLGYKPATRAATSPSRRRTTSPTCARRWSGCSSGPASGWRCSTTRSAPRARRRSTSASRRCSTWPTT